MLAHSLSLSVSQTTHTVLVSQLHYFYLFTHYFCCLGKLNVVKLSIGPSVSWVFGGDENDSEQWEEYGGPRLVEEKGKEGFESGPLI